MNTLADYLHTSNFRAATHTAQSTTASSLSSATEQRNRQRDDAARVWRCS